MTIGSTWSLSSSTTKLNYTSRCWISAQAPGDSVACSQAELKELPRTTGQLVVRNVLDWSIDDQAMIRWYDFGAISYDDATRHVSIRSNFPLNLSVTVSDLDMSFIDDREM